MPHKGSNKPLPSLPVANTSPAMADGRLDRLRNLPLRGFAEIDDDTPSSGTASLPTPQLDTNELEPSNIALVNSTPIASIDPANNMIQTPGAPLLKDYDSFTDGSRAGSFEFLSSASGELFCTFDPVNSRVMGEASNEDGLTTNDVRHLDDCDPSMYIEEWREGVSWSASTDHSISSTTTAKRARSPTPEVVRRIRPRAQSLSSASTANSFDWFVQLPEVIDQQRPPSRASSAPD
ncbi:hypothetical protein AMATHDRAFT_4980 [Amanita thiersii Skay4041]|uniref:Uncharacterized protein n=1 Tax=Amanita thiersii Skay4041 TaxID=703135 RepID=A0A2A9NLY9_9AGAR|nr:hypothetical protein AMATHDRAFT_4980 [Amanita thiersii Skay4041]